MENTPKPPPAPDDDERDLFLIPQLVGMLRWLEELIVALSGYGIVFALGVGVVDLLTNGTLTAQNPWIDLAYAVAFAAAIAGQIIGLASRSSRSFERGQWMRGIIYFALVLVLAFTEYQAAVVFGLHRAFGTPVAQALQNIGLSQEDFIKLRAAVGVILAVLSGFLRWQPKRRKSIAQLEQEADEKIRRAAIQRKERAAVFGNLAGFAGDAIKSARTAAEKALAKEADAPEESPAPVAVIQTRPNGHGAAAHLAKLPQDYAPDDPAFDRYELPEGMERTTLLPLTTMARRLGIAPSTLSTKWDALDMPYEVARADQQPTTMNIAAYHVLALCEAGEIATPANVKVLATA